MYNTQAGPLPEMMATVKDNKLEDPIGDLEKTEKTILKQGKVVDPANQVEEVKDIAIIGDKIVEVADDIKAEKGDKVINCEGLLVFPGLVDMHLHLGDLFEVSTSPIFESVSHGVTIGLSPGAGNTFMAPALLGAEVDRGLPMSLGLYLGATSVLGTMLSTEELIKLFKGELEAETGLNKMTRNGITNVTAPLTVGIKDHMGHFIMPDEKVNQIFDITSNAELIFMSHTQDPAHAERLVELSKGRPIHLAHATAAGCGTHTDPVEGMRRVNNLIKEEHVSGEYVTTMLRSGLGNRDGLPMTKKSQQLAYDALESGLVDILISDGQNDATMKGFGDTRDNIPAIIELAEMGVLSLSEAVATMTCNPAELISKRTGNDWWSKKVGHLGEGALANITIVNKEYKRPTYTIVNGNVVVFENRVVRRGNGSGGWVSKFGMVKRTGVGDLTTHAYKK